MARVLEQDQLVLLLRGRGLRVTAQRLDVHRALAELGAHSTPDDILERVRQRQPSISLNTVYTTLETLRAAGAIRRGDVVAGPLRYDANIEPHHHLVCRRCSRQVDIPCVAPGPPCVEPPLESGFVIDEAQVTFFGLCMTCAGLTVLAEATAAASADTSS